MVFYRAISFFIILMVTVAPAFAKSRSCAEEKGLIILVEFKDVKHKVKRSYAEERFFKQLDNYVREMSYGEVCIGGDITKKWHEMPQPISHYKISPRNLEVDKSRVRNLIDDAINSVDGEVDFSKYSFTVIFMGAQRTEYGMIGLCGYPGMLGWDTRETLTTRSGQVVRGGVAIFSYQAHLGTLFHDIAHILGGMEGGKRMVPCLYDHDLQARPGPLRDVFIESTINMGCWDPMSCHYSEWKVPLPGISSWTRMRLKWLDESKVRTVKPSEQTEIVLGPLEDADSETVAIKIPLSESTYYLIENRQPIGFDRYLPGSGVLIMYADDSIAECRHGRAPVKLIDSDPRTPHLEGAAFDVGKRDSFVDGKRGLKIQLTEKLGNAYRIRISPNEK